jgi:hypothetical protein
MTDIYAEEERRRSYLTEEEEAFYVAAGQEYYEEMLKSMTPHERKHSLNPGRIDLKGGHTHNHVKNAHKRMEKRMHKCHSCGELFPKGIKHFVCNSCVEEAKIEAALDMYEKFNGIIRNQ